MKKEYLISLSIVVIGVGVAVYVIFFPVFPFLKNNLVAHAPTQLAVPTGATSTASTPGMASIAAIEAMAHNNTALLPHASETYQVMQSASSTPKIIQATIDPLGVHIGDTQHLSIVLQDPNPIVSAEALIQTDHGTTTLKLALVGPTQVSELLPEKYYINSQNDLAFVNSAAPVAAAKGKSNGQAGTGVALAATGGDVTYSGSWLVHDTHDTTYITTFVVKDSAGNTNSVVLAWSDACGIPWSPTVGSTVTPSFPCAIPTNGIDGVENANTNISGSLTLSAPFVYNPGYNLTISSGGSININPSSGGVLEQGFLYGTDADGDNSAAIGSIIFSTNPALGGYVHRYNLNNAGDCNDSNANVYPGQTAFFTASTTTDLGPGTYDYNCDGTTTEEYSVGAITCSHYTTLGSCNAGIGFSGSVPGCGVSGTFNDCGWNGKACSIYSQSSVTQACN